MVRDGGPAFPRPASEYTGSGTCPDGNDPIQGQEGMALRDYFATHAMQTLLMNPALVKFDWASDVGLHGGVDPELSSLAYQVADAMLAARGESK